MDAFLGWNWTQPEDEMLTAGAGGFTCTSLHRPSSCLTGLVQWMKLIHIASYCVLFKLMLELSGLLCYL